MSSNSENSCKISIIVPVYNVEQYLSKCLHSLINQTFHNIQIILIDDGSTDRSSQMCNQYALSDDRVKVVHKKNGGLSDARNRGLIEACGEYILFVDSDDYVELNTCEKFCEIIDRGGKPDIITGEAKRILGNCTTMYKYYPFGQILKGTEVLKIQLQNNLWRIEAWLNLYRRNFLIENNLLFKFGILHEDINWTPQVFLKAQSIVYGGNYFYNYIIRQGSISVRKDKTKNMEDIVGTCYDLDKVIARIYDNNLRRLLYDKIVQIYIESFKLVSLNQRSKELINKSFVKGKGKKIKTKIKVFFFTLSVPLYKIIF